MSERSRSADRRPRFVRPRARTLARWGVALAVGAALLLVGRRVPEALARAELFRVEAVELEGARFLTLDVAIRTAAVAPGASVWDDPAAWESRLEAHPLVRSVRVRRRLPATLVFEVVEEEPVALVPTPLLEPVDREGRFLPLDPAEHPLDLPVVRPAPPASGEAEPPSEVRIRPLTAAVERMSVEPAFHRQVSEVAQERDGSLRVRWGADPEVLFLLELPVDPLRIREGMRVLDAALESAPDRRPRAVDLRWADQVLVRY